MSKIITSDNGIELEVCSLGVAVVNHEEETETWARLTDVQRVELAAALDPGRAAGGQWTADDLPRIGTPDPAHDSVVDGVLDTVVHWLNKHHPKPQPYDQGGVRGADSLLYRAERERDAAAARAAQLEKEVGKWRTATESAHSDFLQAAHERDEWKARAEAAEARTAPAVTCEHRDAVADHLWNAMVGSAKSVVRDVVAQAFVAAGIEVAVEAEAAADPVVIFMRESDLPAARVDGDYYVVASAKGDYKWPQHGPSWWAGRAQDALAEAARYTSLARLAAREATVDPVEELAEQIETATRAAIRQACDDLAGVVPTLDPLAVEQAMEVTAASRKVAAHVLGQEESSDE